MMPVGTESFAAPVEQSAKGASGLLTNTHIKDCGTRFASAFEQGETALIRKRRR